MLSKFIDRQEPENVKRCFLISSIITGRFFAFAASVVESVMKDILFGFPLEKKDTEPIIDAFL